MLQADDSNDGSDSRKGSTNMLQADDSNDGSDSRKGFRVLSKPTRNEPFDTYMPPTTIFFAFTIDNERPSEIKWEYTNGHYDFTFDSYNKFKDTIDKQRADPVDNGIYKCVRTLEKDTVFFVLYAGSPELITLTVDPSYWKEQYLNNISLDDMKRVYETLKRNARITQRQVGESVEWMFRSDNLGKYKTLQERGLSLSLANDPPDKNGAEYKCTVIIGDKQIQTYHFIVNTVWDKFADDICTDQQTVIGVPNVQSTSERVMPSLAKKRPKGFGICVIPQKWMLFFNTIDNQLPNGFKWINDNGEFFEVSKNNHRSLDKNVKVIMSTVEDSGIFQCVRTLEDGKNDRVNVVLHVSNVSHISLEVHPQFWGKQQLENLEPIDLKDLVAEIKTEDGEPEMVKWENRLEKLGKYSNLNKKSIRIDRHHTSKPDYREYKCTVKVDDSIQTYFFIVKFLDTPGPKRKTTNVIGVPSFVTMKEKFLYFAYGSNLLIERLTLKNSDPKLIGTAELKGYELEFVSTKDPTVSTWRGGVANITPSTTENSVWGAIWELGVENIPSLDKQEGCYDAQHVDVVSEKDTYSCRTYLVIPNRVLKQFDQRPSPEYANIIIRGAKRIGLPKSYFEKLNAIKTNENTDAVQVYEETLADIRRNEEENFKGEAKEEDNKNA